jgi:hypothetical protein
MRKRRRGALAQMSEEADHEQDYHFVRRIGRSPRRHHRRKKSLSRRLSRMITLTRSLNAGWATATQARSNRCSAGGKSFRSMKD